MKIVLANLPWIVEERTGVRAGSRWPHVKFIEEGDYLPYPFFLGYASALLKKEGFDAKLIDAIAEGVSEEDFITRVSQIKPTVFFVETSAPSLDSDLRILAEIRKTTNAKIAISAPSMDLSAKFLKEHSLIDFIVFGEYEFTLLELAQNISKTKKFKPLNRIKGLIYKKNGRALKNKSRELCKLDELPWPDRTDVPICKYLDSPGEMPLPCAQIIASRGCPFKCIFCAWPQLTYGGRNYRTRSINYVVDEMEFLVKKMGFKSIYFDDDTFNIGKDRMLELCNEIIKRKIRVPWAVMARPDLMDEDILKAMKTAGMWAIKYGVESGSQKIIDNSKKQLNLQIAKRNILLTKKLGIRTHLTFTLGLPGETVETIEETIKLLYELDPFSAQFSIATPFPGTEFYEQLKKKGMIISDRLFEYSGSTKSVVKTESLSALQLEHAVMRIEQAWYAHCKRRNRTPKTFLRITKENGVTYAIHKLASFLVGKTGTSFASFKSTHPKSQIAKAPPSFYDPTKANVVAPIDFNLKQRFNSADILLIMSPPWGMFPPLNLAYLSSYLKSKEYKAGILDMNIELFQNAPPEDKKWWHVDAYPYWVNQKLFPELMKRFEPEINKYVDCIIKTGISIIGFTVHFGNRSFAIEIAKKIKERDSKRIILFGGAGTFTRHDREEYIPRGVCDIFVVGEGEETLYELVKALKNGEDIRKIAGAVIFDGKKFSELVQRSYIKNLDDIPFPTFEELDISKYPINQEALPLLFSRGCISRCTFCNDGSLAGPFRMRSGDNMFQEVKYHVEHNKISNFYFNDLLINGNIKNLERFCDLIIDSGLKITWSTSAIAKKDMTYEVLLKLRKSGCQALTYGVESGSNATLKRMGKLFTAEEAEQVIQDTYRAGIKVVINIIVGFPGETEHDYHETVEFLKRNAKYLHMIGSLNTLCINLNSTLDINQEKYGLIMETEEDKRASTWHTNQGENYESRLMRGNELLNILEKLNLVVYTTNVPRNILKVPK
jgi:anaerobic magnesium-protoporphyrin IX monomethyl ester cyclase